MSQFFCRKLFKKFLFRHATHLIIKHYCGHITQRFMCKQWENSGHRWIHFIAFTWATSLDLKLRRLRWVSEYIIFEIANIFWVLRASLQPAKWVIYLGNYRNCWSHHLEIDVSNFSSALFPNEEHEWESIQLVYSVLVCISKRKSFKRFSASRWLLSI